MYQLAVFDLDGTLFNTQPDLFLAFNTAVQAYGYAPCPPERFGRVIGNGFQTSLRRILPADFDDEDQFADMCRIYHETYSAHYADKTYPYAGLSEALRCLQDHDIKLAVLSNKVEEHSRVLCEKLLPDITFCSICGAGIGYPLKPDPTYLCLILDKLAINAENAVFVGDSDVDVFTAHNAGMTCIGCEWGYRGKKELLQAGADFMAQSPLNLIDLILKKE